MGAHVSNDAERHKSICTKCGRKSTHEHMEGKCRGTVGRHRIGNRDETMVRAHDLWSRVDGERKRIWCKTLRRIHISHVGSPKHGVGRDRKKVRNRVEKRKECEEPVCSSIVAQKDWSTTESMRDSGMLANTKVSSRKGSGATDEEEEPKKSNNW